ncbi:MAG: short-chain fatty acyl-CoA regulator family protein [Alphaproteobacteria bacterium]
MARIPIGYRLRERRRALGMTQTELAQAVGISPSYANLIEHDRRQIGGALLANLARVLGLDLDSLTGAQEARLIQALGELAGDPALRGLDLPPGDAADLVARHPAWSRALLTLYRSLVDTRGQVAALTERLSQDSVLMDIGHQILTHITSIRSSAEILEEFTDLDDARRRQFLAVVAGESTRLAAAAQALFAFFKDASADARTSSPMEEVDDFIIDNRNYFPALEEAAAALRRRLDAPERLETAALAAHLEGRHGIACRTVAAGGADEAASAAACRYDRAGAVMLIPEGLPAMTVRFQLAHLVAELEAADAIAAQVAGARLSSEEARRRAERALASYVAGAVLFPYEAFHDAATRTRYDIDVLEHRFGGSFEQVCHRLVTLRRQDLSGVPFAFMRADPAGNVTKRFSIPGLSLPRYGTACPLWAIYRALQAPNQTVAQMACMPDDSAFLFIARAIVKRPPAHRRPGTAFSVMICCEALYADRIVYGDGLDPGRPSLLTPVGTTCRLCPRDDCAQRAYPRVLAPA